jgi:ABC-type dipeptide/oligopeptide/nickel transport system ATPase subunit
LELRARKYDLSNVGTLPQMPSSGHIIELVGTQGVGKSTLNRAVYQVLNHSWFFRSDLEYTGPTDVRVPDVEALHREIYFRRIDRVREAEPDPWKSLTVSRQMSTVIYESLMLCSNVFPRGFILDEGLFKNFPREVLDLNATEARSLWRKRSFIHLRARDPEVAAGRYLRRMEERRREGIFQHDQSMPEVLARIRSDNRLFDRICERALEQGSAAITVYAEDSSEDNIQRILNFEKTLLG